MIVGEVADRTSPSQGAAAGPAFRSGIVKEPVMRSPAFVRTALAVCLALAATSVALADTARVQAENLARFERFAGQPVDSIMYFQQQGWQPLGDTHFALWTGVNKVYLFQVAKPCINLSWANGIGLHAHMHTLRARFDYVQVQGQPCQIESIRPVDYLAMRKAGLGPEPLKPAAAQPATPASGGI